MKILVLGADGYLGWPTCLHFSAQGHEVRALDSLVKRQWELNNSVKPLWPIAHPGTRVEAWAEATGTIIPWHLASLLDHEKVYTILEDFKPDVIIHYAEQPSAPYSMATRRQAVDTQINNVVGTLNLLFGMAHACPDAHLIKLGTMGEYGTPNIRIEEGYIDIEHKGRWDHLPFPKRPNSFYHASKVHDSTNVDLACRTWGLRATDLNQGIVYGIETPGAVASEDRLRTSFHYDSIFGTVINRFLVQAALGHGLTVYGSGGQKRGFLSILDTLQCVELAALNPPEAGDFRVFNQLTECFTIQELAEKVARISGAKIEHIPNPRTESEDHFYDVNIDSLTDLGLKPHLLDEALTIMYKVVQKGVEDHPPNLFSIKPEIQWHHGGKDDPDESLLDAALANRDGSQG